MTRDEIHAQALERARKEFPQAQEQMKLMLADRRWFLRHRTELDLSLFARRFKA